MLPFLGGRGTSSGVAVTPERALQVAAVYSCVRLLSESVASLPVGLFRRTAGGGRERVDDHPVLPLLTHQPNPDMDAPEMWRQLVGWMGIRGNAYVYVQRDGDGTPVGLWPLSPLMVAPHRNRETGRLYYQVAPNSDIEWAPVAEAGGIVQPFNMLHLRAFGTSPAEGLSPIGMVREQVGTAFAALNYVGGFFDRDASPGGTISVPGELSEAAYERMSTQWRDLHEGFDRSHRLAVLENGATWEKVSLSPADAAFIDIYKLTRAEIAGIYGVPPHMIGDVDRATSWGTGIEQQSLGYVIYSLTPYLTRLETVARRLLADPAAYVRFNVNALLRGDIKTRYESYAIGRQWGWLSPDDIRRKEDEDPIGVNDYLQPLNMVPAGSTSPAAQRDHRAATRAPVRTYRLDGEPAALYPAWMQRHETALADWFTNLGGALTERLRDQRRDTSTNDIDTTINTALALLGDDRWTDQLADVLRDLAVQMSGEVAQQITLALGGSYDARRALPLLLENARASAASILATTTGQITDALTNDDGPPAEVVAALFDRITPARAALLARARVNWLGNFAAHEAGQQAGAHTKTWLVTDTNPRPTHAAAHGQTVPLDDEFAIGAARGRWPHDHRLGVDEIAGCTCALQLNL